jgi:hypothetical protein
MGWFEGTSNQNKPSEIIKHLKVNPKLGDIVRSPLLATILCVLAEHGITLPDKEIRLYEERMNLLLGTYDIYKETTRIVTPKYLLGGLARKIAYEFNVNKCREMGLDEIKRRVFRYFSDQDENALTVGLNELIHPCNILEPMSSQVSFGFGHFRYQEFLAATECNVNRAIKVEEQIGSEFWRGTLELFAQITDDIKFLLTYAINKRMVVEARPTLEAVFRVRPEKERVEFTAELRRQLSIAEKYLSDETVSRR